MSLVEENLIVYAGPLAHSGYVVVPWFTNEVTNELNLSSKGQHIDPTQLHKNSRFHSQMMLSDVLKGFYYLPNGQYICSELDITSTQLNNIPSISSSKWYGCGFDENGDDMVFSVYVNIEPKSALIEVIPGSHKYQAPYKSCYINSSTLSDTMVIVPIPPGSALIRNTRVLSRRVKECVCFCTFFVLTPDYHYMMKGEEKIEPLTYEQKTEGFDDLFSLWDTTETDYFLGLYTSPRNNCCN